MKSIPLIENIHIKLCKILVQKNNCNTCNYKDILGLVTGEIKPDTKKQKKETEVIKTKVLTIPMDYMTSKRHYLLILAYVSSTGTFITFFLPIRFSHKD